MTRPPAAVRAAATCAVLAALAACHDRDPAPPAAAPKSSAPSTPPPATAAATSAAPPREVTYGFGARLRTNVTAAQRASAVPEERAVAELLKAERRYADKPRTVVLGVLEDVRFGAEDGSSLEDRLTWAVTVPDVETRERICEYVLFVDARTGTGVAQFESC